MRKKLQTIKHAVDMEKSFEVTAICREDIEYLGFDASMIDDDDMKQFASKLGNALQESYWISAEILADEYFSLSKK